jgi:hypothetical protein
MDEDKRLLETAVQIGDEHSRRAIKLANDLRALRNMIWRVLIQLRAGRVDQARQTLEQQLLKNQDNEWP